MTERDIQNSLYRFSIRRGDKFFAPNFYLHWEADFISITSDFKVCEYEIKVSRSDFLVDADKKEKHDTYRRGALIDRIPNRFYYVCPNGLIQPNEVPDYAGLLWIDTIRNCRGFPSRPKSKKKAATIHHQAASREFLMKLCRSLMYRYWTIRSKR